MRVSDLNIDRVYINSAMRSADYRMVENHYHYYYELYYIRHGSCSFFIGNTFYTLGSGDFVMIPPHEIHYARYLSQCLRVNLYFTFNDLCDNGAVFNRDVEDRLLKIGVIHVPHVYREIIHKVLDSMISEEKIDDASTPQLQMILLRQLFLYFLRYCSFTTEPKNYSKDEEILTAVQYITEHYASSITLDELAGTAGLSPSYFSKKFRVTTGMGMKEYLTYVRLNHAAMELLSTNHSIMDIAMNCGFSDSNYFKDAFKKAYKMSPRAYRTSQANTQNKIEDLLPESLSSFHSSSKEPPENEG